MYVTLKASRIACDHEALGGDLATRARLGMIYSQVLQRLKKRAFDEAPRSLSGIRSQFQEDLALC